jgi:pantetheine-phosphate adenylyltransferase
VKEYLSPSRQKAFNEVLIGGTFDRLHDGHRQLIAKAFEVGDYVYIGLTTDEYISRSSKKLKDIINPHNTRLAELRRYLFDQGLLSRSIVLPLNDTAGPKALDPRLEALIISEETIAGGDFVNNLRKENSAPALEIIVTPLLTDNHGQIISSTKKRESETQES